MLIGILNHSDSLSSDHAELYGGAQISENSRLLTPQASYEAIGQASHTSSTAHSIGRDRADSQLQKRDAQGALRSISSHSDESVSIADNLQFDDLFGTNAKHSSSTSSRENSIFNRESPAVTNISSLKANTKSLTRAFFLSINKSQIKISGMFLIPSLTYVNSDYLHRLGNSKEIVNRQAITLLATTVMMGAYIASQHSAIVRRYINKFREDSRNNIIEKSLPSNIPLDELAVDAINRKIESHENLVATYGAIGISLLLFINTISNKTDLLLTLTATMGILAYDGWKSHNAIDHIQNWSQDVEHCASDLDIKDNEALQTKVRKLSFDPVIFGLSGLVTALPCMLGLLSLFDPNKSFEDKKSYMSSDVLSGFRIFIGLWPNLTGLRQIALNNGINQLNVDHHLERLASPKDSNEN